MELGVPLQRLCQRWAGETKNNRLQRQNGHWDGLLRAGEKNSIPALIRPGWLLGTIHGAAFQNQESKFLRLHSNIKLFPYGFFFLKEKEFDSDEEKKVKLLNSCLAAGNYSDQIYFVDFTRNVYIFSLLMDICGLNS